ncbi:hypothetical protein CCP3SC1AL1_310019 [Gammaproteobacteria bacterium]
MINYKVKFIDIVSTIEVYSKYRKKHMPYNDSNFLEYYQFSRITIVLFEKIVQYLFDKGETIILGILPNKIGLGRIDIRKMKVNYDHPRLDLFSTIKVRKETGDNTKKVYFLNEHTNGYFCCFNWNRTFKKESYKNYLFMPTRMNKQILYKKIMSGMDYKLNKLNKL